MGARFSSIEIPMGLMRSRSTGSTSSDRTLDTELQPVGQWGYMNVLTPPMSDGVSKPRVGDLATPGVV
jgi:hypothetical protein